MNVETIAEKFEIDTRIVKRWIKSEILRKKRPDKKNKYLDIEDQLFDWCIHKSIELERPVSHK
jgi:hypothetical protein